MSVLPKRTVVDDEKCTNSENLVIEVDNNEESDFLIKEISFKSAMSNDEEERSKRMEKINTTINRLVSKDHFEIFDKFVAPINATLDADDKAFAEGTAKRQKLEQSRVPANKKIEPQRQFSRTRKTYTRTNPIQKPTAEEIQNIALQLVCPNTPNQENI